jgi:rRNA processing protein Krr1/Pno1
MGAVIGRGGQTVNELRLLTGCRVDIASQSEGSQLRTITLTGPERNVQVARQLILKLSRLPFEQ